MILKTLLTTVVEVAKAVWGDEDWFTQLLRAVDMEDLEGSA